MVIVSFTVGGLVPGRGLGPVEIRLSTNWLDVVNQHAANAYLVRK